MPAGSWVQAYHRGIETLTREEGGKNYVEQGTKLRHIDVYIFCIVFIFKYMQTSLVHLSWTLVTCLPFFFCLVFDPGSESNSLFGTNFAYRADCVSDEAGVLSYNSRQDAAASYTHTAALSLPLRRATPLWSDTWSGRCVFARDCVWLWYFLPQLWIMSPQCCCEILRDASSTLWLKTFRCVCMYIFHSLWFPIGIVAIARGRYIRKQYIYAWSQQE